MKSDIEISRETPLKKISEIAEYLSIPTDKIIPFGHTKAKVPCDLINSVKNKNSHLILVTAITPTKAGIGKTTTSVGLSLGLEKIGRKTTVVLREPSLGPCFGMKGGAAGGGYAQVLPMEDINLHFTGDFHAITSANNMIAALLDNYQYFNRGTDKQLKQVVWRRVLDVNDRSLRNLITGLGGSANGIPTEAGFDITPASEIMAVLCLSRDLNDLQERINRIILGYTFDGSAFTVKDLGIGGAITVLLKDAIHPNLVQTTENTPAFIHGGPFANIAHGCNSLVATLMGLTFSNYVVTEAGFGADLGAEKFFNIKCRLGKLQPKATVVVATSQALKLHGGAQGAQMSEPNLDLLKAGLPNLERHLENLKNFGQSVVVSFNQYHFDVKEEMDFVKEWCEERGVRFAINNSFALGGSGAVDLAVAVSDVAEHNPSSAIQFTYEDNDSIETKIRKVVQKIYRGEDISLNSKSLSSIKKIEKLGLTHLPICIAKTQYSFSDDPSLSCAPTGFTVMVEDIILNAGAGFIVVVAGSIMRMPGLPKDPQAQRIHIENGVIEGLS